MPCKNLKLLKLGKLHITDSCFNYHISQLLLIEYFSVYWCDKLESIKISSHRLKKLHILKCNKLVEVEINTPKSCKLAYLGGNTLSFSVTALAYLSKATYQMLHSNAPWNVKKIELLANLSDSKLLKLLNIKSAKVFFSFHIIVHNLFMCFKVVIRIFLYKGYGYTKGIERHSINVSSPSYKVK